MIIRNAVRDGSNIVHQLVFQTSDARGGGCSLQLQNTAIYSHRPSTAIDHHNHNIS